MDKLTGELADFACGMTYDVIPPHIVEKAKLSILDAIACLYGGRAFKPAEIARFLTPTRQAPGPFDGRAIGTPGWMKADDAAFINSSMIRHLDFNDSWHGGHPSDMIGGFLALAESAHADGKAFVTAMVTSYEVMLRLIEAAQMGEKGFDQGFVIGVGTVCGVGSLLRLTRDQIAQAIGMIVAANIPLRVTRSGMLSHWKGTATPYANKNGVFVALLAANGLTGPHLAFEGRNGLFEQVTKGPFHLAPFGLQGGKWYMERIRIKYWPVEQHLQAAVWAARELRTRFKLEELADLVVDTYHFTWFETGSEPAKWDPRTRETADHSLPYTMARALVDGKIDASSWEEAAFLDPALRPLMQKIRVELAPDLEARFPHELVMRVRATLKDGRTEEVTIENPRGDGKNPMDLADVTAKLHSLADSVIGAARVDRVVDVWKNLEKAPSMAEPIHALEFDA